jgi:hypothetical protein
VRKPPGSTIVSVPVAERRKRDIREMWEGNGSTKRRVGDCME